MRIVFYSDLKISLIGPSIVQGLPWSRTNVVANLCCRDRLIQALFDTIDITKEIISISI